MELFIARHPVFTRGMEVFGYQLDICRRLKNYYYEHYREPEDAGAVYRRLCFAGYDESPEQPAAFLQYAEELFEHLVPLLPMEHVIIEYKSIDNSEQTDLKNFAKIEAREFRIAFDATYNTNKQLIEMSDIVKIDFSIQDLEAQSERIERYRGRVKLLAYNLETWLDFKKAFAMGYDYFQGSFFLQPFQIKMNEIRSFNANILRVISELGRPEPSFKEISNIIEHDLNLSYRLLKLVNSAYFALKFKVKTISQAVTMLGMNELNKFASAMLMKETQSPGNTELLRRSLIRGKLMELLAEHKDISQKGSEAFFTGIFSLIHIISGRNMSDIMAELPLTDAVKEALTGVDNVMKSLLDITIDYEKADWESFETAYNLDLVEQEALMEAYISALEWAESLNF